MSVPQLPPEACRFTRGEIDNLTTFDERKELGGLIVRSNEPVKATGWDPDRGEDGLIIPAGSMFTPVLLSLLPIRASAGIRGNSVG